LGSNGKKHFLCFLFLAFGFESDQGFEETVALPASVVGPWERAQLVLEASVWARVRGVDSVCIVLYPIWSLERGRAKEGFEVGGYVLVGVGVRVWKRFLIVSVTGILEGVGFGELAAD
jgi:hypothetical protein